MAVLLGQALDALLEFTSATCGWVGLVEPSGQLQFPARRGQIPQAWLDLQQSERGIWGFAVREGPTLLNELPAWPDFGAPTLTNLLSCPFTRDGSLQGHVVLANKPHGFCSHDVYVVQAIAHLLGKQLAESRRAAASSQSEPQRALPAALQGMVLDRMTDGVLVVDASGALIYANATWADWTGFSIDELLQHRPPFPFWVSHRDLASPAVGERLARTERGTVADFPFRRRDDSIFWCHLETVPAEQPGGRLTVAFLRLVPDATAAAPQQPAGDARSLPSPGLWMEVTEHLPFAAILTDRAGQILWANSLGRMLGAFNPGALGEQGGSAAAVTSSPPQHLTHSRLQDCFAVHSAALLESLFHGATTEPAPFGRLILDPLKQNRSEAWVAYWLAVPAGGFLFALCEDWEALCPPDDLAAEWRRTVSRPAGDWLALLLRPGRELVWWEERWRKLTGLAAADLAGVPSEVALDWLFPRQLDRDFVADLLHQPAIPRVERGGAAAQAVLQVINPGGSRPMLCTFLRIQDRPAGQSAEVSKSSEDWPTDQWLLLVGEPQPVPPGGSVEDAPTARYLRHFARGLSHLLNHYLTTPIGLAEMALDRGDLPTHIAGWFEQVLDSCRRSSYLISSLQDLATTDVRDVRLAPLAEFVGGFIEEQRAEAAAKEYELLTDLRDLDVPVRVNRRMLAVALGHLLRNAVQSLVPGQPRRITIRAFARDDGVCCEIEDTGEGLTTPDWTATLAPFYSTKGPFARDAIHAAMEATGLGLTVSHHLLNLHGGRLELHSKPGEGTTALVILPRADRVTAQVESRHAEPETVRTDPPGESHGPHAKPGLTSAVEPDRPV
jgi:PAS domain S-box-containing protein